MKRPFFSACALVLTISISFFVTTIAIAQKYVNKEYSSLTGLPVNLEWTASHLTVNDNLVTVGNTYTQGEAANMLVTFYNEEGNITWQQEYNNSFDVEDYGIAVTSDESENIYIAGTSGNGDNSSLDITVIKYDSDGAEQWVYTYNNSEADGDDVPTAITMDGNGNLYIVAASEGNGTLQDIAVFKLAASNGSETWMERYDHENYDNVPVDVSYDTENDMVNIGGVSATATSAYDAVSLQYDHNGDFEDAHFSDYNAGIDKPVGFDNDDDGNIVIAGYYFNTSGDFDFSLISLDDELGLNWHFTEDVDGREDKLADIVVDGSGAIYVTGHTETDEDDNYSVYTAKYSSAGNKVWDALYRYNRNNSYGRKITLDSEGNVNVVGYVDQGKENNLLTLQYDNDGKFAFAQAEELPGDQEAFGIETDALGNLYIHGTSSNTSGSSYTTTKYSTYNREINAVNGMDGSEIVNNEILVRFNAPDVNTAAIDNPGKKFGKLSDFVSPAVIEEMNGAFEVSPDFGEMTAIKAFPNLTTADSISITRHGDTITMPDFWTTFLLIIPNQYQEKTITEELNALRPTLQYAHRNFVGRLMDLPDDNLFTQDEFASLEPTPQVTDADIQADRAWDIEHGHEEIRVGVFDSGINWGHTDFSTTGGSGDYTESKIDGGWDWTTDVPVSSLTTPDPDGHGTAVAGIAGAIRNNNEGAPGIAGGDFASNNTGVSLHDMKISNGISLVVTDKISEAIIEGAKWNPGANKPGYGQHVQNHSWGGDAYNLTLREAVRFAARNHCVVVAGSGNHSTTNCPTATCLLYPASFADHFVLKVGASDVSGGRAGFSAYGNELDLIAPGTNNLYTCLSASDNSSYTDNRTNGSPINGTSYSVPHVSGVAALMISHLRRNASPYQLAVEDVEHLMQIYPTDVNDPGHDPETGWGRLNAGEVMEHIEWPFYNVKHHTATASTTTATLVASNVTRSVVATTGNPLLFGTYIVDVYEIIHTATFNTGNATLLNTWERDLTSTLWANTTPIVADPDVEVINVTANSIEMRGYTYHFKAPLGLTGSVGWFPVDLSSTVDFSYSLHTHDPNATNVTENLEPGEVMVYPNPGDETQRLFINELEGKELSVRLLDMQGRMVKDVYSGVNKNLNTVVPLKNMPKGVYFYRIETEAEVRNLRCVKQ